MDDLAEEIGSSGLFGKLEENLAVPGVKPLAPYLPAEIWPLPKAAAKILS